MLAGCLLWPPLALAMAFAQPAAVRPFAIRVVDEQTGRGVPLVELRTTDEATYYTDSNGIVAFAEPAYMGRRVFFHVRSHGYEYPKDGFGYAGVALDVTPGGSARIALRRLNIAERLYRITGAGIYRDSVLVGEPVPIGEPLLDGDVVGQDSVLVTPWRGRLYWFWGDTSRPEYPLGQFQTSGATSPLPGPGGTDPSKGIDLTYFVNDEGFSRPMCPLPGEGPVWVDGVTVVPDATGEEQLVAHYSRVRGLEAVLEHGLAVFDETAGVFHKRAEFDLARTWECPRGHPLPFREDGREYLLFATPLVSARVPARLDDLARQDAYEAYTCLPPATRYARGATEVERNPDGSLAWGWKAGTEPVTQESERELIEAGKIRPEEARYQIRDVESGKPVQMHGGSIAWNAYRGKWILIAVQSFGEPSFLGEVWFSEAESPLGPWRWARRIVTHDHYGLYNPVHHPSFDEDGGRVIYFEGTYCKTFEAPTTVPTPRYEYNQIMYRLDLSDPRLKGPLEAATP
jgi:hypothetical protein